MTIYAVVYGNYSPPEVESLWDTRAAAKKRCNALNSEGESMWAVVEMYVNSSASSEDK